MRRRTGCLALSILALVGARSPGADEAAVLARFQRDVWPLLVRGGGDDSCVGCHDEQNESDLHYYPDAKSNLALLVAGSYFDQENPDSLLVRVSSELRRRRMPPGKLPAWTTGELGTLRDFVEFLRSAGVDTGRRMDERFPVELTQPFTGTLPDGLDNTFLSFRQLRGKIRTIFGDDGRRGDRDLLGENIALFRGADFEHHFSESSKATASFLGALDTVGRELAARAYLWRTGPFALRTPDLSAPTRGAPLEAHRAEIRRLYRAILFRGPTPAEEDEAFDFLCDVFSAREEIETSDFTLRFELTMEDGESGSRSTREISIPVLGNGLGLTQGHVDQSVEEEGKIARHTLDGVFTFVPGDERQYFRISNDGCGANVSFHALALLRRRSKAELPGGPVVLTVDHPGVVVDGSWVLSRDKDLASYEVGPGKAGSVITLPIDVLEAGRYEVTVLWRKNKNNATAVPIELASHDTARLTQLDPPPAPPPGEVRYHVDQSDDSQAFWDLGDYFQFGEDDHVEISNTGTTSRVIADAIRFVPLGDGPEIVVDNHEADGRENWKVYPTGGYSNFHRVGPDVYHDENERKGELVLRYRPALKKDLWRASSFYRVLVGNPARKNHQKRTPVIVRSRVSAPIIRVTHPPRASVGASVTLDASATFTVQGSRPRFRWEQHGGPGVLLDPVSGADDSPATVSLVVPCRDVAQEAWAGLCHVLLHDPDFLFTRPPSVSVATDPREKRRLQLVKIALDLLGRPPNRAEMDRLEGSSLEEMVDAWLRSKEFEDFYFHRIRLYLESHGTQMQDEPVRLWCHVAFNDRPFMEILTADYTVDAVLGRQSRPQQHGRSGILTTAGFIEGKPGLPHFNYAAQVAEKFLGYVFDVPDSVIDERESGTAISTTSPDSVCFSCHKLLTPLAHQRLRWDDRGRYRTTDAKGNLLDDSDQGLVPTYPFRGRGMEAFATGVARKERFIRTMINIHFVFYFGREMRHRRDERVLYREIWDRIHAANFTIRGLIRAIVTSPEYREGRPRGYSIVERPPKTGDG